MEPWDHQSEGLSPNNKKHYVCICIIIFKICGSSMSFNFNFYLLHFIKCFSGRPLAGGKAGVGGGGHLCFIVVSGSLRSSDSLRQRGLSGDLSVQRHTERTCALTLMSLSFTMMLSHEFNYLGLHIKAFYLAATLRSRSRKLHHTKDRLLQQRTQRHPFITNIRSTIYTFTWGDQ